MELLEKRILAEGIISAGDVLRVDSFINHRIDVAFGMELAKEFHRLYKDDGVNLILTIEASGIAIASLTALEFGVPMVFAKKNRSSNLAGNVYAETARSYTHNCDNTIIVSKEYLGPKDRILVIDDFLARGQALAALTRIIKQAGATLVGAGILIEKEYQGGGNQLRAEGIRVESLAKIASLDETNGIVFSR